MLKINNLTFGYGNKRRTVINGLNLSLDAGCVCGLLGPNGAGKSTLLYLIMGALTPRKGSVEFDGADTRLRRPESLQHMMIVPEEITLPPVSLDTYVRTFGAMYPDFSTDILSLCLTEFNVADCKKLSALSMGQKKKIYISFALACRPRLLLMDEPTNGLDIPGKNAFRRLLASSVGDDTTVIISTHQVRDLDKLLDHVAIMDRNSIVLNESIDDIQRHLAFQWNVPASSLATPPLIVNPSPAGVDAMTLNDDPDNTTKVNLELLFEYAMTHKDDLSRLFSRRTATDSQTANPTETE